LTDSEIIKTGRSVVKIETAAVANLDASINQEFVKAVEVIYTSKGRVVLTGMGKSGLIARKIVATLNSTGTAAIYLHPTDALHGDLGMVRKEDVVIIISKSGVTDEIARLLPMFKRLGVELIAMSGNPSSFLVKGCDIFLNISVAEEACPHDLTPTSSTTATLVMGDALSVALLQKRGFTAEDFALIKDIIWEMTSKRFGTTCVVNDDGKLSGIITDGDLRRLLEKTMDVKNLVATDIMSKNPKVTEKDYLASFALQLMENHKITSLVIIDNQRKPIGIVHLHDLVNLGLQSR
jgi:arabinose-5-phosphate isomerase